MLKSPTQPEKVSLAELYSPITEELSRVEEVLTEELSSRFSFVNELLNKSHRLSGKRLRPALLLLFAKACGTVSDHHVRLAAAIEMVHTATLIHDDILDSAEQRRHEATLNHEYGNQSAILTGDFLFSHAFYLTSTLPTTFAAQEIGKSTNTVCEGEMRQIGTQSRFDISEDEYFEIIDSKTAVLCSCAAKLGAHYAQASEPISESAGQFGTQLGIAFQIVDDLLDITGNESETGKSLGTDLEQQKPTLPLIHFLQTLSPGERREFIHLLRQDELSVTQVQKKLMAANSFQYARQKAVEFADHAAAALAPIPDCDAKTVLAALPRFVLDRTH